MRTIVVNLAAGPGAGKSTLAAYIFFRLKSHNVNCELATEFAKDKVWEESYKVLQSQQYIFGKQYHKINRLDDKVSVIVTDSPLFLSIMYNEKYVKGTPKYCPSFNQNVIEAFNTFNNVNYYVERVKEYNPKGRMQTEDQAHMLDEEMFKVLQRYEIPFSIVSGTEEGGDMIVEDILKMLRV